MISTITGLRKASTGHSAPPLRALQSPPGPMMAVRSIPIPIISTTAGMTLAPPSMIAWLSMLILPLRQVTTKP
ncbi:MAG: hypothetical protein BWY77_01877 [bacterium ADurb.Bin431]|nr:MAG: hypothetical protein BWY77_01877 [bacterium ADurb.Bin431]